jgi:D-sedoheptulose 7-phosphate isomerase
MAVGRERCASMNVKVRRIIEQNISVHESLKDKVGQIEEFVEMARTTLESDHSIYFFGNGGSISDGAHIAAEFVGLPVVALTNLSTLTAIANDLDYQDVFRKQLEGLVKAGDLVVGMSTSGNSMNVAKGVLEAKAKGAKTVGLTGKDGGFLAKNVDLAIIVPSDSTPRIQECHLLIGHILYECLV